MNGYVLKVKAFTPSWYNMSALHDDVDGEKGREEVGAFMY